MNPQMNINSHMNPQLVRGVDGLDNSEMVDMMNRGISTANDMEISPTGSPPNQGSSGLISVGGFIGGIVDSEQDHYHHSDHYHHCEDEEGSVMYSDLDTNEDDINGDETDPDSDNENSKRSR